MIRSVLSAALAAVCLAAPALADEVILRNGDVLNGRVSDRTEKRVLLEHPVLGKLDLPAGAVKSVRFDARIAAETGGTGDAIAAAVAATEAEKAAPPPPPNPWKSRFELGFNGSEGNSDALSTHVAFDTKREGADGTWKFDARWDMTESDGVETKNRATAGGRRDWTLGDGPLLAFVDGRYDRDRFTEWDQRARLGAGVGAQFLKSDTMDAKVRVGAAATKEWGSADDDHVRPEALLGLEATWKISESQSVTAHTTCYPDLADTPEYRLVSGAAWTIRLDQKGGISLKLGVDHELDTHRQDPFNRQDLTYYGVLVFDF